MGLPNFVKVPFLKSFLGRLANSKDTQTTVLGFVAAALIGSQVDWGKLLNGDSTEIGKVVGVVVTALFGYFTNKHDTKPSGPKP